VGPRRLYASLRPSLLTAIPVPPTHPREKHPDGGQLSYPLNGESFERFPSRGGAIALDARVPVDVDGRGQRSAGMPHYRRLIHDAGDVSFVEIGPTVKMEASNV